MNIEVDLTKQLKKEFQKFESDIEYFKSLKESLESLEKDINSLKSDEFVWVDIIFRGAEKTHKISLPFDEDQADLKKWLQQTIIAKINSDLAQEKIHMQEVAEAIKKYLEIKGIFRS